MSNKTNPNQIFGLTPHQIRAQEIPVAPSAPIEAPDKSDVITEVTELFQSTYDQEGPDGLIALCYSTHPNDVKAGMKAMLEEDPDQAIAAMVTALTASDEACAAWEAFTSELAPIEAEGEELIGESEEDSEHEAETESQEIEEEPNEPEFKAGEAIESINAYGISGQPVMVSGVKHGCYLAGYNQAKLGTFGQVEASYRRVGEKRTAKEARRVAAIMGDDLARQAQSISWEKINDRGWDMSDFESRLGDLVGYINAESDTEVSAHVTRETNDGFEIVAPSETFTNLEEAKQYCEEAMRKNGRSKYAQMVESHGTNFEVEILDPTHLKLKMEGTDRWGIPLHFAQIQPEMLEQLKAQGFVTDDGNHFVYNEGSQAKMAGNRIAVDKATMDYFVAYFKEYGAMLTRPLAFKKSAKKVAQEDVQAQSAFEWSQSGDGFVGIYKGLTFFVINNPDTGKLDMYDDDQEHIGQAPDLEQAGIFLKEQVDAGRLAGFDYQAGYGDATGKFEAAEKDIKRMEDMRDKADGDEQKILQLAFNMARAINKEDKASRRADAAEKVFGGSLGIQVAKIFEDRARELE